MWRCAAVPAAFIYFLEAMRNDDVTSVAFSANLLVLLIVDFPMDRLDALSLASIYVLSVYSVYLCDVVVNQFLNPLVEEAHAAAKDFVESIASKLIGGRRNQDVHQTNGQP